MEGPQSTAFGRWALVVAVKLVSHECALPWGQDRPVTTNMTTATITITIKQSDTRAPWFLPCTQLHNDTSVCISSPYSGRVNISEMPVSRGAQTVPLGLFPLGSTEPFPQTCTGLQYNAGDSAEQGAFIIPHPKQRCLSLLLQHVTGEARAGTPAQGCLTSTLSQTPPPCHRHLPAINPILSRQSQGICCGLGELQVLIWSLWNVIVCLAVADGPAPPGARTHLCC